MRIKNDSILAARVRAALLPLIIAPTVALVALTVQVIASLYGTAAASSTGGTAWPQPALLLAVLLLAVIIAATIARFVLTPRREK